MKRKPYWEMNAAELAVATSEFDEPGVASKSRPLTPAERRQWKESQKKRGRPKIGKGFQRVSISIEAGLLKKVTACAKRQNISRSKLIALAVRDVIAQS